jgi:ornithine cyclodeaminase
MQFVSAEDVERALPFGELVKALRAAFQAEITVPLRHHHTIPVGQDPDATLLLMPAWRQGGAIGVKQVTVFPGNAAKGLPAVNGVYFLVDGETGEPRAVLDGASLTLRRTAAASALAADYLARKDTRRMVMVGAGKLAPNLIRAHVSVRSIEEVQIWNRNPGRAEELAARMQDEPFTVTATDDLEAAVRQADLISCATISTDPLIKGEWLSPGAHLDLVGGFTPLMREADDEALRRAHVFVDTFGGALKEAGDIVDPLERGVISRQDVLADLFALTSDAHGGRGCDDEITLCKLVGTALEDLAAAEMVMDRL